MKALTALKREDFLFTRKIIIFVALIVTFYMEPPSSIISDLTGNTGSISDDPLLTMI